MRRVFMNHLNLGVFGIAEERPVAPVVRDGQVVDLVPGQTSHWLIIATRPNGEMVRAQVSDEDWKRVIEPALDASRRGEVASDAIVR